MKTENEINDFFGWDENNQPDTITKAQLTALLGLKQSRDLDKFNFFQLRKFYIGRDLHWKLSDYIEYTNINKNI
jgi:hypothetical protein